MAGRLPAQSNPKAERTAALNRWNGRVMQPRSALRTGPAQQKEDIPTDALAKEGTAICPRAAAGPAAQHAAAGSWRGTDSLAENFKVTAQAAPAGPDALADPALWPDPRELTQKLADRNGTPLSFRLTLYQFLMGDAKATRTGTGSAPGRKQHGAGSGRRVCRLPGGSTHAAACLGVPASCRS